MTDTERIEVPGGYVIGGDKAGAEEAFVAARAAELGRKCGSCSLCCKLLNIEEEDITKPAHTWCQHCRPGHGGCSIYRQRPLVCRAFACQWLIDGLFGDEWIPTRSKMVLRMTPGPDQMATLFVYVDDPTVWRRSPYLEQLRERSARMRVIVDYSLHYDLPRPGGRISQGRGGLEWSRWMVRYRTGRTGRRVT